MLNFGVGHVKVDTSGNFFTIIILNRETDAEITVSGPLDFVYEEKKLKLGQKDVELLAVTTGVFLRNYFEKVC